VSARLREGGFGLGGEPSGHVIFGSDLSYLGDGLYTALRVAELLQRSGQNLSEAVRQLSLVPQVLIPVPVAARPELAEISGLREKLADAEKKLDGTGRVVLRYSGTEPVLRVMVEGADGGLVDDLAQGLANHLAEQIGRR
jgi:phosphoglucosamine mutase